MFPLPTSPLPTSPLPTAQTAHPDLDPWHGLLYAITERLTPLFASAERGPAYARYAAGEAIASFGPETRADYASIGRILALSLAAISAVAHSTAPDLPEAEQHRFLSKALSLSRTADQAERVMMARQKHARQNPNAADTLIPRPPERPARYRPLPPDDPASGSSLAARAAKDAQTVGQANSMPDSAEIPSPDHSNPAPARVAPTDPAKRTPQPSRTSHSGHPDPAYPQVRTPLTQPDKPTSQPPRTSRANPTPQQAQISRFNHTNPTRVPNTSEERPLLELAKAMRQAIASGNPPPDFDSFLAQFAAPNLAPDSDPSASSRPDRRRDPFIETLIRGGPEPKADN